MADQYEIRLAGLGGQGLILAGIIMAEAAGIYDGKFVTQTQAYGAAARGGFSRSDVVISDEEINYPKALALDLLLAMSQDAYDEHHQFLKPEGILIIDSTYVSQTTDLPGYAIPFTRIAREKLGRENVANIVALGAITQLFPHISAASMERAVLGRVPKQFVELNKRAFQAGIDAAQAELKATATRREKGNDEV